MAISLSVVVLLAVLLVVMMRNGAIKGAGAVVAVLFGFFLASTGMAPGINRFMNSLASSLAQIKF